MILDEINKIKQNLSHNAYSSEIVIINGIIQPLLKELAWDVFNTIDEVMPEYSISSKRVDLALCYNKKPFVFIEAKKLDGINNNAEEQLLNYAFTEGVPIAILTDGREWHFYLPALQGKFSERRFYKLDLSQREAQDSCNVLESFLKKQFVIDGTAIKNAKEQHQSSQKDKEIRQKLPEAWQKLVNEKDDILIALLRETVSDLCGHNPKEQMIVSFLEKLIIPQTLLPKQQSVVPIKPRPQTSGIKIQNSSDGRGFKYQEQFYSAKNGADVMLQLLRIVFKDILPKIRDSDSSYLNTDKRKFIANSPNDLYRNSKDKNYGYKEILDGWYMATNHSITEFEKKVETIKSIKNVDLKINWGKS